MTQRPIQRTQRNCVQSMSALLSSGKRTRGSTKEDGCLGTADVAVFPRSFIAKNGRLVLTTNLGDIDDLIFNEDHGSHISDK
ncbi:MAG: hypothetical protein VB078_05430 [Clostridiaceae bacterium]|nr:hypothetical protein [Clostridiaceae bacterium]